MKTLVTTQVEISPPPIVVFNWGRPGGGRMLELHKQSAVVRSPQDKERVAREIESTDKSIDRLVYDLYGLMEDEINIVEDNK
jgi:hypothetical protein